MFLLQDQSPRNHRDTADRRSADRFSIEEDVRVRLLGKGVQPQEAVGRTVNISSHGVLFSSNEVLLPGYQVEISISWPAALENKCRLKLVARGRVSRRHDGLIAAEIQKYEFRTRGTTFQPALRETAGQ